MSNKPPELIRTERSVKILDWIFHHEFATENSIDEAQKPHVLPVFFFGWLDANMYKLDRADICEQTGLPAEAWEGVDELMASGAGPERVYRVWPLITLSSRPEPKHRVMSMTWTMLITFDDGVIYPLQVHVNNEIMGGPGFTDAVLGNMIAGNVNQFLGTLLHEPLDAIHDKGDQYGGEEPFNQMMGALIQEVMPKIKEECRAGIMKYVRLCQAILQPVLPPEVKAQIEARKRGAAAAAPAPSTAGGWDA